MPLDKLHQQEFNSSDRAIMIQKTVQNIIQSALSHLKESFEAETNGFHSCGDVGIHRYCLHISSFNHERRSSCTLSEGSLPKYTLNASVDDANPPESPAQLEHQARTVKQVDELAEHRRALRTTNRRISFKEVQLEVLRDLRNQTEHELLELEEEKKRCVAATDDLVAKRTNDSLPTLPTEIISRIFFFFNLQNHISRDLGRISLVSALLEDPQINDDWKRVIARDVPILLSDRTYPAPTTTPTTPSRALGARYAFYPFLPCPQFDPTTYAYPTSDPPFEVLRHATHVAVVLYAAPMPQYPFTKTEFGIPCTQLFVHPRGGEPLVVAREILDSLGNSLLNLRVLDVDLPALTPSRSDAVHYYKPDEEWSPFEDSDSPHGATDFTQSMIHTARIPLSFLPSMLPAFSRLRYFGLSVPASPISYSHLLSSLRSLPQTVEELVLENAVSNREGLENLENSLQNELVELTNLKGLTLRNFNQQVSYALMRRILCPSLLSFSVSFDDYYYVQLEERATEPNVVEGLETEENLPRRIGVSYPTLRTLDISASRQVSFFLDVA